MTTRMAGALLAALCAAGPVCADEVGRAEYLVACSGCHGEEAKGNGPMAGLLAIETPDLTRISAGNGGLFPFDEIMAVIDGRADIRGHGSAMPVWGDRFGALARAADYPVDPEQAARGRILSLAMYLYSIQE